MIKAIANNVAVGALAVALCSCSQQVDEPVESSYNVAANLEQQANEIEALAEPVMPPSNSTVARDEKILSGTFEEQTSIDHAYQVISDAGHKCNRVIDAQKEADQSLTATCDDGERYRIGAVQAGGQEFALKCSAMVKLGMDNPC